MVVVLFIRGWSVVTTAFVQRWLVYAHDPVFVSVDLVSTCPCHSPLCQSVTRDFCHTTQRLPCVYMCLCDCE